MCVHRLNPEDCQRVKTIINQKIENEWIKWRRKDFEDPNNNIETKAKVLILCRAATEARIKRFFQEQGYCYDRGLTLDIFDLLIDQDPEGENRGILALSKGQSDLIESILHQSRSGTIVQTRIEQYIGGNGEQNSGWRVKGLSYPSCGRFLRGEQLRIQEDGFDPFKFLCELLGFNKNKDCGITTKNLTKSQIFKKLKSDLKENSNNINEINILSNVIKSYLVTIDRDQEQRIRNESLASLTEMIFNHEDSISFQILNTLRQDSRLERNVRQLFNDRMNELKNQLEISESEFNRWTSELLEPNNLEQSADSQSLLKHYLILKVVPSGNQVRSEPEYQLQAYYLKPLDRDPTDDDYEPLNLIIEEHKTEKHKTEPNKEYFSKQEITPILTKLINHCFEKNRNCQLVIECFTSLELLSINIDSWEYEDEGEIWQIKRDPSIDNIHMRCLLRLEKKQERLQIIWKKKWDAVQNSLNNLDEEIEQKAIKDYQWFFSQDTTLWGNICTSTPEKQYKLFKAIIKYGIPIAMWSRCHQNQEHRQEINQLIYRADNRLQNLPEQIRQIRNNAPSNIKTEPEHLGHHLSLLWENPYRLPPISAINHLNE